MLGSSVNMVTMRSRLLTWTRPSPTHSTLQHGDGTPPHLLAIFYPPTLDIPFDSCDPVSIILSTFLPAYSPFVCCTLADISG